MNLAELENSINDLMYYLNKHYGKKVMLFIDEYDVPIQEGYLRGYYDEMIAVIRNILTNQKYNTMLKALITKDIEVFEDIFSEFVMMNMSYFDASGKEPEKVYIGSFNNAINISEADHNIKVYKAYRCIIALLIGIIYTLI